MEHHQPAPRSPFRPSIVLPDDWRAFQPASFAERWEWLGHMMRQPGATAGYLAVLHCYADHYNVEHGHFALLAETVRTKAGVSETSRRNAVKWAEAAGGFKRISRQHANGAEAASAFVLLWPKSAGRTGDVADYCARLAAIQAGPRTPSAGYPAQGLRGDPAQGVPPLQGRDYREEDKGNVIPFFRREENESAPAGEARSPSARSASPAGVIVNIPAEFVVIQNAETLPVLPAGDASITPPITPPVVASIVAESLTSPENAMPHYRPSWADLPADFIEQLDDDIRRDALADGSFRIEDSAIRALSRVVALALTSGQKNGSGVDPSHPILKHPPADWSCNSIRECIVLLKKATRMSLPIPRCDADAAGYVPIIEQVMGGVTAAANKNRKKKAA